MPPRFLGVASRALFRMNRFLNQPAPETSAYTVEDKTYHFIEEPLGLPAWAGYGYPQIEFGQKIGPGNRYEIARKLNWNESGSLWLARDTKDQSFVPIKIFTQAHSALNTDHWRPGSDSMNSDRLYEVDALDKISATETRHCVQVRTKFVHHGPQGELYSSLVLSSIPGGRLTTMQDLEHNLAGTILDGVKGDDLRRAIRREYPDIVPLRKRMLRDVLRGLVHLHSHGVVHTELHIKHIGAPSSMTTAEIERDLEINPPRRHPWEASYHPEWVRSAVTQSLPVESVETLATPFYIMDLSEARLIPERGIKQYGNVNPLGYISPPEVALQGGWNEKLDIWQFGCLVYQVLSQEELFYFLPRPEIGYPPVRSMLWQMTCTTGERFPDSLRSDCRAWDLFFEKSGNLMTNPPLSDDCGLEFRFSNGSLDEDDIAPTSAFVRRCLRLDPGDRPSALELLSDPWFDEVDE